MAFANGDFIGVSAQQTAENASMRSLTQFGSDEPAIYQTVITARDQYSGDCYT